MTTSDFEFTPSSFNMNVNSSDFRQKVGRIVSEIIHEAFRNNIEKANVIFREERLNFACPYCGDSARDNHKKRGNIYLNDFSFHCYNCRTHVSFEDFLKDFGKSIDGKEIVYVKNLREKNIQEIHQTQYIDNSYFFDENVFEKYAIDKSDIFKSYDLVDIKSAAGNWIRKYLTERHQFDFNLFGWDPKLKRLFIFNLTKSGKVLGMQVRNFKSEPKYITHTLEMLYKHLDINYEKTDEFLEINRLSFLFGLSTTDFNSPIIITEGPLDSFLISNAMSVCGTGNEFPFEIANIRWMYDKDAEGMKHAMKKLSNGEYVFLWKKYIKDVGLDIYTNKVDYTDIVKFARINKKNLLPLHEYFSNDKYDSFWL